MELDAVAPCYGFECLHDLPINQRRGTVMNGEAYSVEAANGVEDASAGTLRKSDHNGDKRFTLLTRSAM